MISDQILKASGTYIDLIYSIFILLNPHCWEMELWITSITEECVHLDTCLRKITWRLVQGVPYLHPETAGIGFSNSPCDPIKGIKRLQTMNGWMEPEVLLNNWDPHLGFFQITFLRSCESETRVQQSGKLAPLQELQIDVMIQEKKYPKGFLSFAYGD